MSRDCTFAASDLHLECRSVSFVCLKEVVCAMNGTVSDQETISREEQPGTGRKLSAAEKRRIRAKAKQAERKAERFVYSLAFWISVSDSETLRLWISSTVTNSALSKSD